VDGRDKPGHDDVSLRMKTKRRPKRPPFMFDVSNLEVFAKAEGASTAARQVKQTKTFSS
jgi:hypothetical protein